MSRGLVNICELRAGAAAAGSSSGQEINWTASQGGEKGSVFHFDVGTATRPVLPREGGNSTEAAASDAVAGANWGGDRQAAVMRSLNNPNAKPSPGHGPPSSHPGDMDASTAARFGNLMAALYPTTLNKVLFRPKPSTAHSEASSECTVPLPEPMPKAKAGKESPATQRASADVAELADGQPPADVATVTRELSEEEMEAELLARMREDERESLMALMSSSIKEVVTSEEGSSEVPRADQSGAVLARQRDRPVATGKLSSWLDSPGAGEALGADNGASEGAMPDAKAAGRVNGEQGIREDGVGWQGGAGHADEILARACSPEARARQRWMEREADQAARAAFQKEQAGLWSMGMGTKGHVGKALIGRWLTPMQEAVKEEQAKILAGKGTKATIEACKDLAMLDPAVLSFVTLYR